jgi:hypothetical protein
MQEEKGCFWCVNREGNRCLEKHLDLKEFGNLQKLEVGCRCVTFEPKNKHTTFVFR